MSIFAVPEYSRRVFDLQAAAIVVGSMVRKSMAPILWLSVLLGSASAVAGDNPFLDLVDVTGKDADVSSAIGEGKWTLVMLWATDCHICTKQKPEISAFYDKHKSENVDVFGIALDGRDNLDDVNSYLTRHQPTFPNYVGEIGVVAVNYQMLTEEPLRGTPTYLLFNPEGELKGNNPGPVSPGAIESFIAKHTP